MTSQLAALSKPIPERFVEKKPGKFSADYVAHGVVEEFLIGLTGRVPKQEIVREIYDGDQLTGCVLRLSTVIDGQEVVVEEAGDDDGQASNNGARLKNAVSDAYKRCAMRMTLGLSLWVGAGYFLDKSLAKDVEAGAAELAATRSPGEVVGTPFDSASRRDEEPPASATRKAAAS